jgi:membrane protein
VHIVRQSLHVLLDAFYRFNRDDGWAIASRIALSILMSVFPFLIVVTAIAGSIGSVNLANEVARLLLEAWPDEVAGPLATEIHHALSARRIGHDRRRIRALFLFEWNREPAHRAQQRL